METILIVDDDPLERNMLVRSLTEAKYAVLEASSASEAVRISSLFEGKIHVVVLTYPSGLHIARDIAAVRPNVAFLLTSASPLEQLASVSQSTTIKFEFLHKPFFPTVLTLKVREMLNTIR